MVVHDEFSLAESKLALASLSVPRGNRSRKMLVHSVSNPDHATQSADHRLLASDANTVRAAQPVLPARQQRVLTIDFEDLVRARSGIETNVTLQLGQPWSCRPCRGDPKYVSRRPRSPSRWRRYRYVPSRHAGGSARGRSDRSGSTICRRRSPPAFSRNGLFTSWPSPIAEMVIL